MIAMATRQRGFNLIELLIVVVIVGILASIAVPGYRQYSLDTGRTAAAADLHDLSLYLERAFTAQGRYDDAANPGTLVTALPFNASPQGDANVRYNISLVILNSTSYTLAAVPTGGQTNDTDCDAMRIDEAGTQCILGGTTCSDSTTAADREAVAACW